MFNILSPSCRPLPWKVLSQHYSTNLEKIQKEAYTSKCRKANLSFRINTRISYLFILVICSNPCKATSNRAGRGWEMRKEGNHQVCISNWKQTKMRIPTFLKCELECEGRKREKGSIKGPEAGFEALAKQGSAPQSPLWWTLILVGWAIPSWCPWGDPFSGQGRSRSGPRSSYHSPAPLWSRGALVWNMEYQSGCRMKPPRGRHFYLS